MSKLTCVWGRQCGTEDDPAPCDNVAAGVVAVKDGATVHKLVVCHHHRMRLVAETAPV